jgi:hypothetical protein
MRNIQMLTLDSAKLVVLALLGSLCTLCSLACLPSLGLGIALLSEQTAAWFRTLQWNPVPVASLLKQIGYAPHADWPWIQSGIDQLLRLESGPTVITAGFRPDRFRSSAPFSALSRSAIAQKPVSLHLNH